MDYFSEVCDVFIKPNSKFQPFKSKTHKELHKCKHIKLTIENPDINNIDRIFYEYNIQHIKKYEFYLVKCEFKLCFNDIQYCQYHV